MAQGTLSERNLTSPKVKNKVLVLTFICLSLLLGACGETAVTDVNNDIKSLNWDYGQRVRMSVNIEDPSKEYNLYMNLRITANYRYSNIFVLISREGGGEAKQTQRREFKLALPDGEWLGSGSGNFYTFQLPFQESYKFPARGTYYFTFEQNMRDNPLKQVCNVGLRVEPVKQ